MEIAYLEDEFWYGGCVKNGTQMPLSADSEITVDTSLNTTPNQAMPLFISSKGRYIWKKEGFKAVFSKGTITVPGDCYVSPAYGNLKNGYLHAMQEHFPFQKGAPNMELFKNPIYNTWIELTFYQNQTDVLRYADGILDHDMPPGVLMIDDGWSEYYGDWTFHSGKFPDPKAMIRELHAKGFKVMLWLCPFISADTVKYREALAKDLLIKDAGGEAYIVHWWNGFSAVLDMSNPEARAWLKAQLDELLAMGVDGFKFDAGDSFFYTEENQTYGNTTPNEQSILWKEFGEQFAYNEFRVTFNAGGAAILQRLCDKHHTWNSEGVGGLIPDSLLQGITGHPFSCPDMIGGGEYVTFHNALAGKFDQELFVRHCQIACLMPAMQFSAAPYRVLTEENFEKIMQCVRLRREHADYLLYCVEQAATTGEPILRYMTYEFPEEAVEKILDQFMLGSRFLVAPIVNKGVTGRQVYLPRGQWKYHGETIQSLGETRYFEQGEDALILFERETA